MSDKRAYRHYCPLARALDLLGERWTLLIIRDLLSGPRRYKDLQQSLRGIGTNLLARRLRELQRDAVVEQVAQPPPRAVRSYQLTERGRALEGAITALAKWGLPLLEIPRAQDQWEPQWNPLALRARFNSREADGISATYAFEIGGYPHCAVIREGALHIYEGILPDPDLLIRASSDDFLRVIEGELNFKEAMQQGMIEVEGAGEALLQMARLFTVRDAP